MAVKYVKAFNADLGELSLNLGNDAEWKRYIASRIARVAVTQVTKKSLFSSKQVEQMEVFIEGEEFPYVIQEGRLKDDYIWAKEIMKKFCDKNKVKFAS